jgi:heat shock protein HtpX
MDKNIGPRKFVYLVQAIGISVIMVGVLLFSGLQVLGATGLAVVLGTIAFVWFLMANRASPTQLQNVRQLTGVTAADLESMVTELSQKAGLGQTPDIYVMNAPMMTAASFHDDEGPHLIVTPQLLSRSSDRQLRSVLAHEISHVEQKDFVFFRFIQGVRLVTVTVSRVGWFMLLLYFPVLAFGGVTIPITVVLVLLLAPLASVLLQFAVMRAREMSADLGAVELTQDPEGLAQALEKIDSSQRSLWSQVFPMPRRNQPDVLRTHPSVPRRISQLRQLETQTG